MARRTRQRSLFPEDQVRAGFPELTRCEVCGKLEGTHQYDVAEEKRWLHRGCYAEFRPLKCSVVYRSSGHYQVEEDLQDDDGDDEGDDEEEGWRSRRKRIAPARDGAVVLIDGVWHGYRHNASHKLFVHASESREEVLAAFRQSAPPPRLGWYTLCRQRGVWKVVDSVRWCGGLQKCACYDDGEVTAHWFRWEEIEIVKRKVKVRA